MYWNILYTCLFQMDAVTSYGLEFPVSVWMKKVAHSSSPDPRVVVVIEPVERCSVQFTLNEKVWSCLIKNYS